MSLLTARNLAKSFGADDIFEDISLEIPYNSRIALVGPNGAGKTTLLNILIGHDTPTEGTVAVAKNTRIGFLPQRPELVGKHSLWQEQLNAFTELRRMEAQLHQLEHDMADADKHDEALAKYGPLQERFDFMGGYTYEQRIKTVLQGLGFDVADFEKPLPILSGGQKTRALLARLLLDEPDLLVLDEPTNHLDIQAVEWLEGFLKSFPGAVLAVSHDRYFMDAFAQIVWELDFGTLASYRGNYSHYVRQREERHERLMKEYEAQQEFIAKEEEFIRRNMGSRGTAQAKGRLKRLETMKKRGKIISAPKKRHSLHLRMGRTLRSGDKVLMTKNLVVGYHDDRKPLFTVPDITLYRGEVAALIGPNGVGKSTFLKTVLGQLGPLKGESTLGAAVKIGYFAQAHELLNPKNSILDEVMIVKGMPVSEMRNYLAQFLFTGDDVFRPIETLSGGERGRVALAKLALSGANFLLLDEPTNHLDIESQEILQTVLDSFDGTILLVSHDRYLIDALASQIWAANPGDLQVFEGPYAEYVAERDQQKQAESSVSNGAKDTPKASANGSSGQKRHGLNPYQLEKRLAEVETNIHQLETRIEQLNNDIFDASSAGDAARVRQLGEEYTQAEADLHTLMDEWAILME
ncbi:MAG: ABC-F family ATP-binding cassette domain-containing protein [Anaerolineae bacterium]|nr:ABC-F family ATP-binding cassette domain-containing protein [Anaerolineae bacterium]